MAVTGRLQRAAAELAGTGRTLPARGSFQHHSVSGALLGRAHRAKLVSVAMTLALAGVLPGRCAAHRQKGVATGGGRESSRAPLRVICLQLLGPTEVAENVLTDTVSRNAWEGG